MRRNSIKMIGMLMGPLAFCVLLLSPQISVITPEAQKVIAVALWMLIWWVSEAVEIPVTALLPIILLPTTGVMNIKEATAPYSNPIIYLFMGGFMIALAMEKWNLHRRIALSIVKVTGTNANGIILGFMLATAFLSAWISNTATTVMMLPIATSIIDLLMNNSSSETQSQRNFNLCLLLGIAYAANVGGIATLIGTPPNSVAAGILQETYGVEIGFAAWAKIGAPLAVLLLGIVYTILVKVLYPNQLGEMTQSANVIEAELTKLGKISSQEKKVLWIFVLTACLWIGRSSLNKAFPALHLSDGGIAIAASILLFVLPADKKSFILSWQDTPKLPWGILILFGGGLSLAKALSTTGIITFIGDTVAQISYIGTVLIIVLLITVMLFMTEFMSNVALTAIFIPVVGGIALSMEQDLLTFTVPVTIAASCAFMLPMSTPPNAIVFASGHIRVSQMVRSGALLNTVSVLLLAVFSYFSEPIISWAFGK